ncbi:MAG: helix-turn-helix transcriptional regulator [Candidatus Cloacimonadaceae bacterium]|nr:helix-turn-helix transcriptional regulator [Candidatus Cloacimonadaceae bacterium]
MKSKADGYVDFDFGSLEPWKETLLSFMGQLLKARLNQKISQEELARRMNVKQSVISRFEHAGRIPTFEFLYRITKALDMNLLITPYGDRTVILSPEQYETVMKHAQEHKSDVYTVVGDMIACYSDDSYVHDSSDEFSSDDNYRFQYRPESNDCSIAACSLS